MKQFNMDQFLKDLEYLVNIDSGSKIPEGTAKVADFFEKAYKDLGLSVVRKQAAPEVGPFLEIRNKPETERIDIMFAGHMDTVFPAGEVAKRPFRVEGNRAYGPGCMDMKGGDLAMYYIAKELLADNTDISFCIAMNSDEEISSNYSKEYLKELARKSDYAVVMEPGRPEGEYVRERKGLAKYKVEFQGIPSHAGNAPQDGASAIHEAGYAIQEVIKLINYEVGTSLNVGTISGGTTPNVVAEHAEFMIDTRFDLIEEHYKINEALDKLCANPQNPRVNVTWTMAGFRPPMVANERADKMIAIMNKLGAEMGMPMKWLKAGGVSDANFIAFEGCATIDGASAQGVGAHTSNEILYLEHVEPKMDILYAMMKELFNK